MAVDIPKFWEYFAAIVSPMIHSGSFQLSSLAGLSRKACGDSHKCVAGVLAMCAKLTTTEAAGALWTQSGLTWTGLGLDEAEVSEFLDRQVLFIFALCSHLSLVIPGGWVCTSPTGSAHWRSFPAH